MAVLPRNHSVRARLRRSRAMPRIRLELSDGQSHTFWEIQRTGSTLKTRWGRIGTAGQDQAKTFSTPEAARKEHDKLVASKRQKGYADVGTRANAPTTKATTVPAPARPRRTVSLIELSGLGQMGPELDAALAYGPVARRGRCRGGDELARQRRRERSEGRLSTRPRRRRSSAGEEVDLTARRRRRGRSCSRPCRRPSPRGCAASSRARPARARSRRPGACRAPGSRAGPSCPRC